MLAGSRSGSVRNRQTAGWHLLESLAVFLVGVGLMQFIYAGSGATPGGEPGVPGNDSFYHIKMAAMIPEHGLLDTFPWLRFTYFTEEGDAFVSHHYGFHLLLMPFVKVSQWLTGDCLPGARWAMSTFFGLNLMLFNLLLITGRVRWRWLWLLLFLLMPFQFFTRHSFVRAISPSLMFMLLIVLLMFRRRYLLAGIAVACYTHLYLGAVLYAPLLVGLYALSMALGPSEDRVLPWRMVALTAGGWVLGVLTYPYAGGIWEFLKLQVFGSGLSPDIPVGREWKPYEGVWWFANMAGPLLIVWAGAICARLRAGGPINAKALALMLMSLAFLVLTLKARRFVEYWPVFCLLSAAFLAAPLLERLAWAFEHFFESAGDRGEVGRALPDDGPECRAELNLRDNESMRGGHDRASYEVCAAMPVIALAVALWIVGGRGLGFNGFLIEWQLWAAVAALYLLVPLARVWGQTTGASGEKGGRMAPVVAVPFSGALFVACMALIVRYGFDHAETEAARFIVGLTGWIALAAIYLLVALVARRRTPPMAGPSVWVRVLRSLRIVAFGVAFLGAAYCLASRQLLEIQRLASCKYDLPEIRRAMSFLEEHSEPGDVVFTDDWDIFPVYFYYNSHNNYIVGLDPKFTHARRPDLWQRYVKVSRGQVPADTSYTTYDDSGEEANKRIHVKLVDIRDHFGARFVITDCDHKPLAAKLAAAGPLAELLYPSTSYSQSRDEPYLIFRIRDPSEAPAQTPVTVRTPNEHAVLYLGSLAALSVEQGWGDVMTDRSVGGGPIHLRAYPKKCGTGLQPVCFTG